MLIQDQASQDSRTKTIITRAVSALSSQLGIMSVVFVITLADEGSVAIVEIAV